MRMIKPCDQTVLRGNPIHAVRDDFANRLARWIEPYADEPNTTQLDMLYAYKSTGHFGAYRAADEAFLRPLIPFYLKDVFRAAVSVDYRYRNNHRLMRHIIQRLSPDIAALPTTRGGPAQPWRPSNVYRFLPYYARLGRKAVNKLGPKLVGRPLLLTHTDFPWSASANATVLRWLFDGQEASSGALHSAGLYNPGRLEHLLASAERPGFKERSLLGRVVTVELALRAVGTTLD